MPIDYNAVAAELKGIVAAQWPDIVRNGNPLVYEVEHVESIPFEKIAAEQGLPYAVIVIGETEPATDLGLTVVAEYLDVEIYWIGQTMGQTATQRTKGSTLASYLRTASLTTAQVWDDPDPRPVWGKDLEINELLRSKKLSALAGGIEATLVVGE